MNVCITGAGMTRFGKRDQGLLDLMAEAALAALADAGIERPDVIVVAAMNPEEFTGEGNFGSLVGTYLGLSHVPAFRVETATSSGMAAVYVAFAAIASGTHASALVVGGEKMTHLPTPRVSEIIGRSIDPHERSYGSTMPALAGLVTRAAMHRRGLTLKEISQVAVKNHAHGARNPYAHFREPVTLEAVHGEPHRRRSAAAPALLPDLGRRRRARPHRRAERRADRRHRTGDGLDRGPLSPGPDVVPRDAGRRRGGVSHGRASDPSASRWRNCTTRSRPSSCSRWRTSGLVPAGKAGRATLDGETAVGGRLPVNPSGGLKARGHPLAATGVAQLVELVWQLRGLAEGRQVEARVGLAQSIGGLASNNWVTLLEARR